MLYSYELRMSDGELASGQIEAESLADAIVQLQDDGAEVLSIHQTAKPNADLSSDLSNGLISKMSVSSPDGTQIDIDESTLGRLEAFAKELPRGSDRREIQRLAAALRTGIDPGQLASQNPGWLPLLGDLPKPGSGTADVHDGESFLNEFSNWSRRRNRIPPLGSAPGR